MAPKAKAKAKAKEPPPKVKVKGKKEELKPKKIPPPPACFSPENLAMFKELYKAHDEENIDKVPLTMIPLMLRKVGFNPKTAEINELFRLFLEDNLVDTVEYHEFLQMLEAKMVWGDDFEKAVTDAMAALGHDDDDPANPSGIAVMEVLREELFTWGEPFQEIEFVDFLRLAAKDKTLNLEDGTFNYVKFIENMNNKDVKFLKEPINFFKLDQKTLAEMAQKKAQEEREEQEKKEAEKKAREEARRQKMIADGLIPPD